MIAEEKINILLVDDSQSNLLALESILQAPDRTLVRATSGDEALRYLLDAEVAVILLDVYMPGIDGLQTAELIRSRERSKDIPIIFLTADSSGHRHLSRGYSLGAVDYIVKPVEPEILRSKVAVFVDLFKKTRKIEEQTRLLQAKNAQLRDTYLGRLNKLIDLGQKLAAEHEPAQVLRRLCESARDIVGAQHAVVGMVEGDSRTPRHLYHYDAHGETGAPLDAPQVSEPLLNILLGKDQTLRLNESDDLLPDVAFVADEVKSFLGARIRSPLKGYGWLYLLNKLNDEGFTEADERLAETLITGAVIAYENATLYEASKRHEAELQCEVAERVQAEEERAWLLVREQAARAEAEEANRTKDEFLSTISHELRTPLTAILGWSHLARTADNESDLVERALDTIERNALSQARLIDDLLDVSRIITGKLTIDMVPVDLSHLIGSVLETVRPSFEAKGVVFETVFDSGRNLVSGDASRLQQVFWNLFTNAVKFTPAGGRVTVTLQHQDGFVDAAVSDTGVGIELQFLPYIFDRFRQADGSTTRRQGGLGLGLAIVRHLVEIHKGTIEVHSGGVNQGATFRIRLALLPDQAGASNDRRKRRVADTVTDEAQVLEGLRVLVVDDEADSLSLLNTIVTRSGGEVRCCCSAANAMKEFRSWAPDVLVSDIGMPDEDGYSLIRRLREQESNRVSAIPAIALTAYATPDDRAQALAAGFQVHLAKPIAPETLVDSIARAVGRKSDRRRQTNGRGRV
jgi:signal transduction histidine kinase/response regulator RpfG family c-di-GMP phosphodiesterase